MYVEDRGTIGRAAARLGRHRRWLATEGVSRMVEEDNLNPLERLARARDRRRWRATHGVAPGEATPLMLVGVQRSGTNMLTRALGAAPEIEVHGENDRRAFVRFQLRPLGEVAGVVARSRHQYVLLKPLCDSHRVPELLQLPGVPAGKALWMYRDANSRVASAVAKFGDVNRRALADIASGEGLDRWQAGGMSPATLELVRSFDYDTMTPESGAALFWYLRNVLYFEHGLDEREDVRLVSYRALVDEPADAMRDVCDFLGLEFRPALVAGIGGPRRAVAPRPLEIDPVVRQVCDDLQCRLDATYRAQLVRERG
jgi:hypothetical protein